MQDDDDDLARQKRPIAWVVRQVHFYVSLTTAGLILFYAVTGFLASRSDLFNANEFPTEQIEGEVPADVALEPAALIEWFALEFPGRLREKSVISKGKEIRFELGSVWSWHTVEVNKQTRRYLVESTASSQVGAWIGMHRGRWAGIAQHLLIDLTALSVALVVLTGAWIGLSHPLRTRRMLAITLLVVSVLLCVLLCLGR